MVPIGLVLLFLTGFGPIVGWKKSTPEQLKKSFLFPVLFMIPFSLFAVAYYRKDGDILTTIYANLSISLCAFVLATVFLEYRDEIGRAHV